MWHLKRSAYFLLATAIINKYSDVFLVFELFKALQISIAGHLRQSSTSLALLNRPNLQKTRVPTNTDPSAPGMEHQFFTRPSQTRQERRAPKARHGRAKIRRNARNRRLVFLGSKLGIPKDASSCLVEEALVKKTEECAHEIRAASNQSSVKDGTKEAWRVKVVMWAPVAPQHGSRVALDC